MAERVKLIAPAKVNLYLAVSSRRHDGYHELATVFQALDDALSDTVQVRVADEFSVKMAPDLGVPAPDNLALKAAEMLADAVGAAVPVAVTIEKRIPAGGGLGGASTDAAAVLVGASVLWGVDTASEAVTRCAHALGADVPFFLQGGTALYAGRGDVRVRDLPTPDLRLVVVNAGEPVSTAAAYAMHDRLLRRPAPDAQPLIDALDAADVERVAALLHNDLAEPAKTIAASIREVESWLAGQPGVLAACVTGSGSCAYGICESEQAARAVERDARREGWWAQACAASRHGVRVVEAV